MEKLLLLRKALVLAFLLSACSANQVYVFDNQLEFKKFALEKANLRLMKNKKIVFEDDGALSLSQNHYSRILKQTRRSCHCKCMCGNCCHKNEAAKVENHVQGVTGPKGSCQCTCKCKKKNCDQNGSEENGNPDTNGSGTDGTGTDGTDTNEPDTNQPDTGKPDENTEDQFLPVKSLSELRGDTWYCIVNRASKKVLKVEADKKLWQQDSADCKDGSLFQLVLGLQSEDYTVAEIKVKASEKFLKFRSLSKYGREIMETDYRANNRLLQFKISETGVDREDGRGWFYLDNEQKDFRMDVDDGSAGHAKVVTSNFDYQPSQVFGFLEAPKE